MASSVTPSVPSVSSRDGSRRSSTASSKLSTTRAICSATERARPRAAGWPSVSPSAVTRLELPAVPAVTEPETSVAEGDTGSASTAAAEEALLAAGDETSAAPAAAVEDFLAVAVEDFFVVVMEDVLAAAVEEGLGAKEAVLLADW